MTPHHLENRAPKGAAEVCKLTLISELLFHIANDSLDLSRASLLGMVDIVDEVAGRITLQSKEVEQ